MRTLATLCIPQFYTLYGRILGGVGFAQRNRYYCAFCHTEFFVDHHVRPGIPGGSGLTDNRIICPCCGHMNLNLMAKRDTGMIYDDGKGLPVPVPMEMRLEIRETKDCLSLWVWERVIYLEGTVPVRIWKRTEEFRYNLRTRDSFLIIRNTKKARRQYPLYDIFSDCVYKYSQLFHVNACSLALFTDNGKGAWVRDKERTEQVKGLLRTLREALQRKWKKMHGYDLGPLYVGAGPVYGMLLFPLVNLAWRLRYPDGQNLPHVLSETQWDRNSYLEDRLFTSGAKKRYFRYPGDTGGVRAIIQAFDLPDRPFIRHLLARDLLAAPELKAVLEITEDPYYITRILLATRRWVQKGTALSYQPASHWSRPAVKLYSLLKEFTQHWSLQSVVHLLEKEESLLADCAVMLHRVTDRQREAAYGLKLKNLHNWLVLALRTQQPLENINLEIPEAVTRRLQMQLESGYLNFFVPDQSKELDQASDAFHNCVKTYRDRVHQGECQIVLMTDDIGRMLACLEVRGNALVQAKLKYNKPVFEDAVVNGAVRDWCRKANLVIETADVHSEQGYLVPLERKVANG